MSRTALILVIILVIAGCSDNEAPPNGPDPAPSGIPNLTVAELLAAPDSLIADSLLTYGEPYLNRDFMPFANPKPVTASMFFQGYPDAAVLPSWASEIYLWAIRDSSEVWATKLTVSTFDVARSAYQYEAWSDRYWDPGIQVNVVIGVRTSPTTVSLVLFRDVTIHHSS